MKRNFDCVLAYDEDHYIDRFIGLCDCNTRNIQIQNNVVFRKLTDCASGTNLFDFSDDSYLQICSASSFVQLNVSNDFLTLSASGKNYEFGDYTTFTNENIIFNSAKSCVFMVAQDPGCQATEVTILDTVAGETFKVLSSANNPTIYECSCLLVNPNLHTTTIQGVSDDSSCYKLLTDSAAGNFELCSTNECFVVGNGEINLASSFNSIHVEPESQCLLIDQSSVKDLYVDWSKVQLRAVPFNEYVLMDSNSFTMCCTNYGKVFLTVEAFSAHHNSCVCVQSVNLSFNSAKEPLDITDTNIGHIDITADKLYIGNADHFNIGHILFDCGSNIDYGEVPSPGLFTGTAGFQYSTSTGQTCCFVSNSICIINGLGVTS